MIVDAPPVFGRTLPPGMGPRGLRNHNERLVLSTVQRGGSVTAADIARLTQLSAQTVSVITRALEADGLLARGEVRRGRVGKPTTPLHLASGGVLSFGLRIGRRSGDLVLIDFTGAMMGRRTIAYPYPTPATLIDFTRGGIDALTRGLVPDARARITGIGVGAPFELWNWLDAVDAPAEQMAEWRDFDLAGAFAEFTNLPVHVGNDATMACSGEHVFGQRHALEEFAYLHVGSFVGGGLVLGGRLFTGATGNGGAFGSIPVCGPGAPAGQLLETASLHLLERDLAAAGIDPATMWDGVTAWDVFEPHLTRWLDVSASHLATAAIAVVAVTDVPVVVVDGTFPPDIRDRMARALETAIVTRVTTGIRRPRVVSGTLGPSAGAMGAAYAPIASAVLIDGGRLG